MRFCQKHQMVPDFMECYAILYIQMTGSFKKQLKLMVCSEACIVDGQVACGEIGLVNEKPSHKWHIPKSQIILRNAQFRFQIRMIVSREILIFSWCG